MIGRISNITQLGKDIVVEITTYNCEFQGNEVVEVKFPSKNKSDAQRKFFHTLSDSMADYQGVSKIYMKNFLLGRYGQRLYEEDGTPKRYIVREEVDMMEQEFVHCVLTGFTQAINPDTGELEPYAIWDLIKPTADYTSKEMSVLIDGAISEAKEMKGVDTTTPQERERIERLAESYSKR